MLSDSPCCQLNTEVILSAVESRIRFNTRMLHHPNQSLQIPPPPPPPGLELVVSGVGSHVTESRVDFQAGPDALAVFLSTFVLPAHVFLEVKVVNLVHVNDDQAKAICW